MITTRFYWRPPIQSQWDSAWPTLARLAKKLLKLVQCFLLVLLLVLGQAKIGQVGSWNSHFKVCYVSNRVVTPGDTIDDIGGISFKNFNSHYNAYPCAYLTAAAAIGIQKEEIDLFIKRLQKVFDAVKHEMK